MIPSGATIRPSQSQITNIMRAFPKASSNRAGDIDQQANRMTNKPLTGIKMEDAK